jgi:hypothetical protein
MNIITWYAPHGNGAFQMETNLGLWSDLITTKPLFSFSYTSMNYNESANQFDIDGEIMTVAQQTEVLNYINQIVPPISWVKNKINNIIISNYKNTMSQYSIGKSQEEIATFTLQYSEATKVVADASYNSVFLNNLVQSRGLGETVQLISTNIITKYLTMITAQSTALGIMQNQQDQLATATTAESCLAIVNVNP